MADYVLEGPKWGSALLGADGGTVYWSFADPAKGHRFFDWDAAITGDFQSEIARAFDRWQSVADIRFVEVTDSPDVDIRLGFDSIDGNGGIAGETQYASGPDNRFQAAEISFDDDEGWHLQNGVEVSSLNASFYVVALHEIGHSLGLDHYNARPAVMNAVLTPSVTDLTQSDKDGITALYGDTTPPVEPQSTLLVALGGSATLSTAFLLSTDNVSGPDAVMYRIARAPAHGTLLLDGVATHSFTQADIDAGRVRYVQNGDAAASDGFTCAVSDAAGNTIGPEPFAIAIVETTDPVAVGTDAGVCAVGGDLPIWKDALCTVALGRDPAAMVYRVVGAPAHGALLIDGRPADSFTQADIDDHHLAYVQRGGPADSDGFSFVVTDGAGGQTAPQIFHIAIQGRTPAATDPAVSDFADIAVPGISPGSPAAQSDGAGAAGSNAIVVLYLDPIRVSDYTGDRIASQ